MINDLSSNLPGAKFTYIDVARMFEDVITNARSYGKYFIKQIVLSRYY